MNGIKYENNRTTEYEYSYIMYQLGQWITDSGLPYSFIVKPIIDMCGITGITGCEGSMGCAGPTVCEQTSLKPICTPNTKLFCHLNNVKICGTFELPKTIAERILKLEDFVFTKTTTGHTFKITQKDVKKIVSYRYGYYKKEGMDEIISAIKNLDSTFNSKKIGKISIFECEDDSVYDNSYSINLTEKLPYKGINNLVEECEVYVEITDPEYILYDVEMSYNDLCSNYLPFKKMLYEASFHLRKPENK